MDPNDTKSPLHQPPDQRPILPPEDDPVRRAEAGEPLDADDIVPSAPAKREQQDRVEAEREAEGGGLATGIGDDRP